MPNIDMRLSKNENNQYTYLGTVHMYFIYLELRFTRMFDKLVLYKYDIPVGFPPGITSPREDCC